MSRSFSIVLAETGNTRCRASLDHFSANNKDENFKFRDHCVIVPIFSSLCQSCQRLSFQLFEDVSLYVILVTKGKSEPCCTSFSSCSDESKELSI